MKFRSVAEFEAYLNGGTRSQAFLDADQENSKTGSEDFTGTASYEAADELLKYGDRKSYEMIKQGGRSIEARGKARRTELFTAICGVTPNVPAYLAGSPAAMINTRKKTVRNKVLKIYYNCAVACDKKTKQVAKAAAAVLQTVCDVEATGTRVELNIMIHVTQNYKKDKRGQHLISVVCVKRAEERLDPLKIAYPCVNPSFPRRHNLRFIEVTKGVDSSFVHGYGYPVQDPNETKAMIKDTNAVFLSCESIIKWEDMYKKDPTGFIAEEIHDQLNG